MEKKIEQVRMYRFQSHADTTISFTAGLNSIIGPSDSGKTAVFRAIRWVLYNKPSGSNFTTYGQNHCFVSILFTDKIEIIRGRKSNENYYIVKYPDGTKKEFTGFGHSVPGDVQEAHGMTMIEIDPENQISLNMAPQLDAPFLLSESGAFRAKAVGKLNGAYIVDATIQDINRDIVACSTSKKKLQELITTVDESLKQYEYLDQMSETIEAAAEAATAIKVHRDTLASLQACHRKLTSIEKESIITTEVVQRYSSIEDLNEQLLNLEHTHKTHTSLLEKHNQLNRINQSMEQLSARVNELNTVVELSDVTPRLENLLKGHQSLRDMYSNICTIGHQIQGLTDTLATLQHVDEILATTRVLGEMLERRAKLSGAVNRYGDLGLRITDGKTYITNRDTAIAAHDREYATALRSSKECPLCGQNIPHGHEIQNSLFGGKA